MEQAFEGASGEHKKERHQGGRMGWRDRQIKTDGRIEEREREREREREKEREGERERERERGREKVILCTLIKH